MYIKCLLCIQGMHFVLVSIEVFMKILSYGNQNQKKILELYEISIKWEWMKLYLKHVYNPK